MFYIILNKHRQIKLIVDYFLITAVGVVKNEKQL